MNAGPTRSPATLDHAGIAQRVPHTGRMCLLHALLDWSPEHIVCSIHNHGDPQHPLRTGMGLLAPAALEYASQAMALHSALNAAPDAAARAGFLVSARGLSMQVQRLDNAAGPLHVRAVRQLGDQRQAMYSFELHDTHGSLLVEGRATVVLDGVPE